jgi:hypothetical protein
MGIIYFEEGNMDEALASLLLAERSDPRLPDLHLRIGDVYLRRKESMTPSEPSSARWKSTATARRLTLDWPWSTYESGAMSKPPSRRSMPSDCSISSRWATFIWE